MTPTPRPATRVGDREREQVAEVVADALAEGLVGLEEVDARLGAVWEARSRDELAAVTADLPESWLADRVARRHAAERQRAAREAARTGLRAHLLSYLSVMALLAGIWLVVGMSSGAWYPWPVWPALGWGLGLVHHVRAAYGRPGSVALGCRVR